MIKQFVFFTEDVRRMLGKNKFRIIFIWLSRSFLGCFIYRLERALFLVFGRFYSVLRVLFYPLFTLVQVYTNMDIHYKAKIQGGLLVLHPAVGIVISAKATIGKNLTLVGGNIIGFGLGEKEEFRIGNNCSLGANAVIIGPLVLADNIKIGASACVVKSCEIEGAVLVGVPAKQLNVF
jgi:serine acetyltransferase